MKLVKVNMREVVKDITVSIHVTGVEWWRIRMLLARGLIKLGTLIMGMKYKEIVEEKDESSKS